MFSVEVTDGYPPQMSAEITFHLLQQVTRQPLKIDPITKLGSDNELPQAGISLLLPYIQNLGRFHGTRFLAESCGPVLSGALAGDVSTMSSPLPSDLVF